MTISASTRPSDSVRVLPPDVTADAFDAAIAELVAALGDEWVHVDPAEVSRYDDEFPVTGDLSFTASAVVYPGSTEDVQRIVRIANEYLVPLHAISTGKNLGYGGAAPRVAGSIIVHVGRRLNRVLELNEKYAYALIEPGVTYFELYAAIQEKGYDLWIDGPDLSWGSIVGNTLDRGVGYTPYGNHSAWKSGMEIVLPDGDVLRTGMGGIPGSNTWQLFAPSFGPQPDNLFEQSNFGIVTKMGVQLMGAPPAAETFQITFDRADDLGAIIDTMLPLRINMAPLQNVPVLRNIFLDAAQVSARADWHADDTPIPDEVVDRMKAELGLGYWNLYGTVYGPPPVIEQYLAIIEGSFGTIPGAKFSTTQTRPLTEEDRGAHTLHDRHRINTGIPTIEEANLLNWLPDGAHMGFSPISAPDGEDALRQFRMVKARADAARKDYAAQFVVGLREMHHISLLLYSRTDAVQRDETLRLVHDLIDEAAAHGYGEYRAHHAWADHVADTYSWNDHAQRRFNERLKDALDPRGILNPGKAGIWPARLRGRGL
ncbi:FAD-binding oxidoreductase [Microbacterium sp. cx-55]|uniref:FAD-binding oxidoreductase n=1 Tax=Microbacterium sp. cx-55 TaxID=2875948 RepID=UPI001CBF4BF2|nr:FAD-binding oxidoreductase [Microbacterium sp. cx-55]MBZ4488363.1 FAD-binding oxidoreductase [Microbacterium sp. cx-55]UGB35016.1 FAD-binding oxidoreductase [Microbacterium sp. cx-55]